MGVRQQIRESEAIERPVVPLRPTAVFSFVLSRRSLFPLWLPEPATPKDVPNWIKISVQRY